MTVPAVWRRRAPLTLHRGVLAGASALVAALSADGTNLPPIYVLTVPPTPSPRTARGVAALLGLGALLGWAIARRTRPERRQFRRSTSGPPSRRAWPGRSAVRCAPGACSPRSSSARRSGSTPSAKAAPASPSRTSARGSRASCTRSSRRASAPWSCRRRRRSSCSTTTSGGPTRRWPRSRKPGAGRSREMRRILGVLRHAGEAPELAPQPGVGQIHALVERSRDERRRIELSVDGEPGPLPASVDLGALPDPRGCAGRAPMTTRLQLVGVQLRFGERDVELEVSASAARRVAALADAGDARARRDLRRRDPERGGHGHGPGGGGSSRACPRAFEEAFA